MKQINSAIPSIAIAKLFSDLSSGEVTQSGMENAVDKLWAAGELDRNHDGTATILFAFHEFVRSWLDLQEKLTLESDTEYAKE